MFLSEIRDISRFTSTRKLRAFAGLYSSVYQSGNFEANALKKRFKSLALFKTYYSQNSKKQPNLSVLLQPKVSDRRSYYDA